MRINNNNNYKQLEYNWKLICMLGKYVIILSLRLDI